MNRGVTGWVGGWAAWGGGDQEEGGGGWGGWGVWGCGGGRKTKAPVAPVPPPAHLLPLVVQLLQESRQLGLPGLGHQEGDVGLGLVGRLHAKILLQ